MAQIVDYSIEDVPLSYSVDISEYSEQGMRANLWVLSEADNRVAQHFLGVPESDLSAANGRIVVDLELSTEQRLEVLVRMQDAIDTDQLPEGLDGESLERVCRLISKCAGGLRYCGKEIEVPDWYFDSPTSRFYGRARGTTKKLKTVLPK